MAKTKKKTSKKKVLKKAVSKKTTAAKPKPATKKIAAKVAPALPKKTARPAPALLEGSRAPAFSLPNEKGELVSLSSLLGKTVVLYFYPKDDTPGCTKESCDFRDSFSRVQAKGAIVLGVSRDSQKSHEKFRQKYSLPFSLLSDEDGEVCETYGVWKEKSMYGKTFMGIVRTTYVIKVDEKGNAVIKKIYPQVKVEGHVDQILKDLA